MGTLGSGLPEDWAGVSDVEELDSGDELDTFNDETFGGPLPPGDLELGDLAQQTAQLLVHEPENKASGFSERKAGASGPLRQSNPWPPLQPQELQLQASLSHLVDDDDDHLLKDRAPDPSQLPTPGGLFSGTDFVNPFLDATRERSRVWEPLASPTPPRSENGRPQPPPSIPSARPAVHGGKVATLEEIEAEMLRGASRPHHVPGVLSLEEVERQMLSRSTASPPPPLPLPRPPPYERAQGGSDPSNFNVPRYPPNHPLAGNPIPPHVFKELMEQQRMSSMMPRPPMGQGPPPWLNPQVQIALRAHLAAGKPLPPGFPHPALIFGRPPPPGLRGPPPPFMRPPPPREVGTAGPLPHHHQMRMGGGRGMYDMERRPQAGRRMFADLADGPYGQPLRGVDPYAGLMSRREKEWLTKIQMMQLESDNPYQDDYYFTMLRNRAFAAQRRESGKADPEPMFFSTAHDGKDAEVPLVYVPPKLEGSLGKIPHLSMNFPRQLIDITAAPATSESGTSTPTPSLDTTLHRRKLTNLLMEVERMWDVLLELEWKRVQLGAASEEQKEELRAGLHAGRASLLARLSPDRLPIYLSLRKGRDLVGRLLGSLGREEALSLLSRILATLPILVKRDEGQDLYRALFQPVAAVAKRIGREALPGLLAQLTPDLVNAAAEHGNRLTLSLVLLLLVQGSVRCVELGSEMEESVRVWLKAAERLGPVPWLAPSVLESLLTWLPSQLRPCPDLAPLRLALTTH